MTSERDKLVEAVAKAIYHAEYSTDYTLPENDGGFYKAAARAAIAVVYDRLREVTPAMVEAWGRGCGLRADPSAQSDWLAMLAASPLAEGNYPVDIHTMPQHLDKPGDRPAIEPTDEIEITPEMIQAGAMVIWRYFDEVTAYGSGLGADVAIEVFQAMKATSGEEK